MIARLTDDDVARMLAVLRPRGDAWRNGGSDEIDGSVMGQVFGGLGASYGPAFRRVVDLVDEFYCSTALETVDAWAREYGVPDGCDPFADVCEKVNAVGDTTPAYAVAAAARRGWSITIDQVFITNVEDCCCGLAQVGMASCGATNGVAWVISVSLSQSAAYVAQDSYPPLAGLMRAGDMLDCPADIAPLVCLLRRIGPAHADLDFITTI